MSQEKETQRTETKYGKKKTKTASSTPCVSLLISHLCDLAYPNLESKSTIRSSQKMSFNLKMHKGSQQYYSAVKPMNHND